MTEPAVLGSVKCQVIACGHPYTEHVAIGCLLCFCPSFLQPRPLGYRSLAPAEPTIIEWFSHTIGGRAHAFSGGRSLCGSVAGRKTFRLAPSPIGPWCQRCEAADAKR